ncbi:MAG: dihydrodipicolinate synthase family protein [Alphaproteobacteria bacterium]|nr:dihydrodipicolinate synthase family protein [Alphaproteobacteria bacterium]
MSYRQATPDWVPEGVIPAVLLPFHADFSIDDRAYRKHLRDVAAVDGISALTVNGHSCEVHACSLDEQREVLRVTMEEVGDRLPVVAGVYADGSLEAARIARMAEAGGASALLVFPPQSLAMGGQLRPELGVLHFRTVAAATGLPLICFNYTASGPLGYPHETLLRLADEIPTIRAVKDWSGDAMLHERNIRALQSLPRPVNVLSTHSAWLMSSLVLGCNGLLSGAGSVIAAWQVALFRAVRADDLAAARAINDRIYPMAQALYAPPFLDMHNRMKEVLALIGKLPPAVVRPPLAKLPAHEIERLRRAIAACGLDREEAPPLAAE